MQDSDLDGLFALAAQDRPKPSLALMDRVLADAEAAQPRQGRQSAAPAPTPPGLLARLAALFGGGPVLAGVCSAAVVGVALGYMDPASMDSLTSAFTDGEAIELFPSADFLTNEG